MSEPSAAWTSIERLGTEEALAAVDVGAEADALLLDREDRPVPLPCRRRGCGP